MFENADDIWTDISTAGSPYQIEVEAHTNMIRWRPYRHTGTQQEWIYGEPPADHNFDH